MGAQSFFSPPKRSRRPRREFTNTESRSLAPVSIYPYQLYARKRRSLQSKPRPPIALRSRKPERARNGVELHTRTQPEPEAQRNEVGRYRHLDSQLRVWSLDPRSYQWRQWRIDGRDKGPAIERDFGLERCGSLGRTTPRTTQR